MAFYRCGGINTTPPSPSGDTKKPVVLYDYDGTVIASYTAAEFANLSSYPIPPSHEYLTFDEYNHYLEDAKAYVDEYGFLNIGATYSTTDGATKLFVTLSDGALTPNLKLGIDGSVDVDWGDGSTHDTMVGTDVDTPVYQSHTYSTAGNYVISFSVTGDAKISSGVLVSLIPNNVDIYALTVKKIFICGNISIGDDAFARHYTLSEIMISNGVDTSIGSYAFYSCSSLKSITIPSGITSIELCAFNYCNNLASVILSDTITDIGDEVFDSCNSLKSITIPYSITSIGGRAFYYCTSLTNIIIPYGIEYIYQATFSYCTALTSIIIPDSVSNIYGAAFDCCSALTSITVPDYVSNIEEMVFHGCSALTSITIPDSITSLGDWSFYDCYALTSITIPYSVTDIGGSAFYDCYSLGYIRFESETPPTISDSNVFYNIPTTCIIYVPSDSLEMYKSARNYPSSSTYTYVGY